MDRLIKADKRRTSSTSQEPTSQIPVLRSSTPRTPSRRIPVRSERCLPAVAVVHLFFCFCQVIVQVSVVVSNVL